MSFYKFKGGSGQRPRSFRGGFYRGEKSVVAVGGGGGGSALHYWYLDETSGVRSDQNGLADLSPNTSTIGSAVGKINNAAQYSGNSNYLTTTIPSLTDDALSFAFWVKLAGSSFQPIFSFESPAGGSMNCIRSGSTGKFRWSQWGAFNIDSVTGADTNWHFIVCSKNGSTWELYLDDGSDVVSGSDTLDVSGSTNLELRLFNVLDYSTSRPTTGMLLDEFVMKNGLFTQAEKDSLYSSGSAGRI